MTATLTKWYEEHGRHEIFAGGKKVKMDDEVHSLLLREDIVTNELQHDLDTVSYTHLDVYKRQVIDAAWSWLIV